MTSIQSVSPEPDPQTLAVITAAVGAWARSNAEELHEAAEVRAVIAAVVASLYGKEATIRHIMSIGPVSRSAWARAGRETHQRSHALRMGRV